MNNYSIEELNACSNFVKTVLRSENIEAKMNLANFPIERNPGAETMFTLGLMNALQNPNFLSLLFTFMGEVLTIDEARYVLEQVKTILVNNKHLFDLRRQKYNKVYKSLSDDQVEKALELKEQSNKTK